MKPNLNKEIIEYLEEIIKSPIADEEYYATIGTLFDAIHSIADSGISLVEDVLADGKLSNASCFDLIGKFLQITTLLKIIEEKVNADVYMDVMNMAFTYEQLKLEHEKLKQQAS
jgi:hypothetical protein